MEKEIDELLGLAFSCSLSEEEHDRLSDECKELVCSKIGNIEPFNWLFLDELIHEEMNSFTCLLELNEIVSLFHCLEFDEEYGIDSPYLTFKTIKKGYLLEIIKKSIDNYVDCRTYEKAQMIKDFTDGK